MCGSRRSTRTACCRCAPPIANSRRRSRSARSCRRSLRPHLDAFPRPDPLADVATADARGAARGPHRALAGGVARRSCARHRRALRSLPIDHGVAGCLDEGRVRRGGVGAAAVSSRAAPSLSRRACPARSRRLERPLAVAAFRPHLGPRDLRRVDDAGGLDAAAVEGGRRRQTRGLVGREPRRRGLSRRARDVARAWLQPVRATRRLRSLRVAAGVGARDARRARARQAPQRLHARSVRARGHSRSAVERGADRSSCARGACTTICACCGARRFSSGQRRRSDALDDDDPVEQQVRARWPRSQLVQRHLLVSRPLRSALGSRAPDLRHGPLHELGEHRAQAAREGVHPEVQQCRRSI